MKTLLTILAILMTNISYADSISCHYTDKNYNISYNNVDNIQLSPTSISFRWNGNWYEVSLIQCKVER